MESEIIFKALLSLGLVFAAMYFILKVMQKYSNVGTGAKRSSKGTGLKIENIVYIDEGTKVVNISNKSGSNYVIAVGKNNSFLVDKYKADKEKNE
jgi:hypothetical protein